MDAIGADVACVNRAMSTITMNHARRVLTPGASSKRKERETPPIPKPNKLAKPTIPRPASPKPSKPASNNQLLAGYLAHEFLTKGTLFGDPWDPARAEAFPVSTAGFRRMKPPSQKVKPETQVEKLQRYAEVADLIQRGGAHLPGIVNPTQLAHFLQL